MKKRKRRTREHGLEALSINHVERFILHCGYSSETHKNDYGIDLSIYTYDKDGYVENGVIYCQLKATDRLKKYKDYIAIDLEKRDIINWIEEIYPVFLVVYDAKMDIAYCEHIQKYFEKVDISKY